MTEEMNLLGESDDYSDLSHLPPKERAKMRRLRDWLSALAWSPSQANAVLCGYDPESSFDTRAVGLAFLPGAYAFYGLPVGSHEPDDLLALDAGIEEQRGYVRGLRLTTMRPEEAIAKTSAAGVLIPWLDVARADPECRKYLPHEVLDATADAARIPLTSREVASLGGNAKRDNDPKRKRFYAFVQDRVNAGMKASEIIEQLIDEFGDEPDMNRPSEATVYRWAKKIKTDASEGNADVS